MTNSTIGDTLLHKIKDAVPKSSDHEDRFEHFMESLPQGNILKWINMVEAWEMDRNKPNPFAWTVASKTVKSCLYAQARNSTESMTLITPTPNTTHTNTLKFVAGF
ncbi:hypothetical protein EDD18DRAFT_1356197 [Armillaria luteobubalina]|uniref:Uncharacterized protein n=1 Tax=Armillaria luteobubalina TaxID=153913 RepID=A0AA39UR42_9AGAR|nr:hypothetical protein EDD18DRAFT_1356197 [Armillaria luteobubalina]